MMLGFNNTKLIDNLHNKNKKITVHLCTILIATLVILSILTIGCANRSAEALNVDSPMSDSPLDSSDVASQANLSHQSVTITEDLTGNIKIDSSGTVFPIVKAVA